MDRHPSQNLTISGRLLVFAALIVGFAATWACYGPLLEYVAGGAAWGGLIFFPGLFAGLIFFCAGATMLRIAGVRIFKQPAD